MTKTPYTWLVLPTVLITCSNNDPKANTSPGEQDATLESYFTKNVDVFGVPIFASAAAPDGKLLHAATVLADYLDNDNDGRPDDSILIETLVRNDARVFMAVDREELDDIFEQLEAALPGTLNKTAWHVNPEGITAADWIWQDLSADETLPDDAETGEFDGALEEILHLISHVGLANAYPDDFAERPGSRLGEAMDKARGGQFLGVPDRYPEDAWYTYDDETCVYQCQTTEYFDWALTSLIGAQVFPGRLDEIGNEWRLNTKEKLRDRDPAVYALLIDPKFKLPQVKPDGTYTAATLNVVSRNEWLE